MARSMAGEWPRAACLTAAGAHRIPVAGLAVENLAADALEPSASFSTWGALTARFVAVKLHEILHAPNRVGSFGDHSDAAGAEHAADRAHRFDAERYVKNTLAMPRVHWTLGIGRVYFFLRTEQRRR